MSNDLPLLLLVEDDEVSKDIIIIFLKDVCNIEFAKDGPTAVEMLKNKKFDGFLMDINLGRGIGGIDVVHEIKKLPQYDNTPIIAITAYAMVGDKEEFLEEGCTHYISKPFLKSDLRKLVKEVLHLP